MYNKLEGGINLTLLIIIEKGQQLDEDDLIFQHDRAPPYYDLSDRQYLE